MDEFVLDSSGSCGRDHFPCRALFGLGVVVVCEQLALILSGQGLEECDDLLNLLLRELLAHLVAAHRDDGILQRSLRGVVVVGGRQGDVAQSGHLEAVAVALILGLLCSGRYPRW